MENTTPLNTRLQAVRTGVGIAPKGRILASRRRGTAVPEVRKQRMPETVHKQQRASAAPGTSWKMLLGAAVFAVAALYAASAPITPTTYTPVKGTAIRGVSRPSVMSSAKQIAANYYNASYVRDVDTLGLWPPQAESEEQPQVVLLSHAPRGPVRTLAINPSDADVSVSHTRRAQAPRVHTPAMVRRVQEIIKFYAPKGVDPKPLAERIVWESARQGYDPLFVAAVIKAESRFNSSARSHVGARGLMQIMPATGRWLAGKHNIDRLQLYDRDQNLKLGIAYLKELEQEYGGDKVMTLVAYNWGPGHVQSAGRGKRRIPGDVMRYAVRILNDYRRWRGDAITPARAIG